MGASSEWAHTDLYGLLGVAQNASDDEIRRAFRRRARELHPDTNPDPDAERRFREVAAAHDVLGDPRRRRAYDETRRSGPLGSAGDGSRRRGGGTRVRVNHIRTDPDVHDRRFGDAVRGGSSSAGSSSQERPRDRDGTRRARRGADAASTMSLPFLDAVHGTTRILSLVADEPCATCAGAGRTGSAPCPTCDGRGTAPRSVTVRIPPGVEDGQKIRLPARGAPGRNGGPAGDLYVTVEVEPHPVFGRDGDDITISVPVTYAELVLGTELAVPTIDGGTVTVRVPPGTPSGRTLRLRGRGVPGTSGDLLVTLEVSVPPEPSDRERELIEQLRDASTERPRARWEEMS